MPKGCLSAAHLDVITLEKVQVWFSLPRLLTHQRQDGVIIAGVHDGLAVLHCAQWEILQLILRERRKEGFFSNC